MTPTAMFTSQERGLPLLRRGKVRDVYRPSDDHLIIVACDRISAFDHVLPTPIPTKGIILTQMSNFWFRETEHLIANHIVDDDPGPGWYPELDWYYEELKGRTVLVRNARPITIEAIVRGYLSGSGWKEYQNLGTVCGIRLPKGLKESAWLPETIFTPSTKAQSGHDENISFNEAASLVGREVAERVRDASLALYGFAAEHALGRGIIIADTKFEFGIVNERDGQGDLILIDEIFTPDSSRFWPADTYEPGRAQFSFDKQFVRDYLESIGWNKEAPAPPLPDDVIEKTREKYQEALVRLTS